MIEKKDITPLIKDYDSLDKKRKKLLDLAEDALVNSYNPYSGFCVGAAILTDTGEIITGANYENSSYGLCICAERAALVRANAMGYRKFKSIAVIGRIRDYQNSQKTDPENIVSPCGPCRQMLFEANQLSDDFTLEVIMSTPGKTQVAISSITELLPLGFGPRDIGVDISSFK